MTDKYDNQNVFMKIIQKEIDASHVYEDDLVIAIMDIMPYNPGHVLVIPKLPIKDIFAAPKEILNRIILVAQKISIACKNAFQADGIKIMQFNGSSAGQTVHHLHFHIIPCKNNDNVSNDDIHRSKKIEKLETLESNAQKIRNELSIL